MFITFSLAGVLLQWKHSWQRNPEMTRGLLSRPFFRRALFIVGLLLRYFDFIDPKVIEGLPVSIFYILWI